MTSGSRSAGDNISISKNVCGHFWLWECSSLLVVRVLMNDSLYFCISITNIYVICKLSARRVHYVSLRLCELQQLSSNSDSQLHRKQSMRNTSLRWLSNQWHEWKWFGILCCFRYCYCGLLMGRDGLLWRADLIKSLWTASPLIGIVSLHVSCNISHTYFHLACGSVSGRGGGIALLYFRIMLL